MKNLKLFILLFCFVATYSCEEDTVRPLVNNDSIAPGNIEVIKVDDFTGGSTITYNLPNDNDLLYVVAEFSRGDSGEMASVKSSAFSNTLTVEGFAKSQAYEVKLYAVDQSENRSEPVTVTIKPETPSYVFVCSSIEYDADFGGIRLTWDNPYNGVVSIEVYSVDDATGDLVLADVIYTESSNSEGYAIRGFESVETDFVIIAKDRYDNQCGQINATVTPLFEELVDRAFYQAIVQTHDSPTEYGWTLDRVYNGVIGNEGFHTSPSYSDPDGELPEYADWSYDGIDIGVHMFTLDLGKLTKLSRFKFWQRVNYYYRHGNTKIFDLWGATDLNDDGTLNGWTLLLENAEVIKPSGTLTSAENTDEDNEFAAAGHDFIIPNSAPPVRYIRFAQKLSWNYTSAMINMTEIEFYGDIID